MAKNEPKNEPQLQKESFVGKVVCMNNLKMTATILEDAEVEGDTIRSRKYASSCQAFGADNLRVLLITEKNEAEIHAIRKAYRADF